MVAPISKNSIEIYNVVSEDLHAISAHYASEVTNSVATFDTSIPPLSYWEAKLRASQAGDYPFMVARKAGRGHEVCGWFSLSPYDAKEAYARCAEFSVYVLTNFQGRGIGKRLMERMLEEVQNHPTIETVISRVVPTQVASVRLHEAYGFRLVGTMVGVGDKLGSLRDVSIYQHTG